VFVDFDSGNDGFINYTASMRNAIIATLDAIYGDSSVTFVQTAPGSGSFSTVTVNEGAAGGVAEKIDFRNLDPSDNAVVNVDGLGVSGTSNIISATSVLVAHELGHILGLRHADSFGALGDGISPNVNPGSFLPTYPGPQTAIETNDHVMVSPASVGSSISDLLTPSWFSERSAIKLQTADTGAVVTEDSWAASTCDPCPGPTLTPSDLTTLGLDAVGGQPYNWTLTRLHYRYTHDALGDDLVFRPAPAIVGGRGMPDAEGVLTREVSETGSNNFQGRYAILHPWEGEVSCDDPQPGRWGGPPGGAEPPAAPATNLAFAARGNDLGSYLAEDLPELSVRASDGEAVETDPGTGNRIPSGSGGCASCAVGDGRLPIGGGLLVLLVLGFFGYRRLRS